jgi:hypothetical protein
MSILKWIHVGLRIVNLGVRTRGPAGTQDLGYAPVESDCRIRVKCVSPTIEDRYELLIKNAKRASPAPSTSVSPAVVDHSEIPTNPPKRTERSSVNLILC